jgi:hypothetical protein
MVEKIEDETEVVKVPEYLLKLTQRLGYSTWRDRKVGLSHLHVVPAPLRVDPETMQLLEGDVLRNPLQPGEEVANFVVERVAKKRLGAVACAGPKWGVVQ